MTYKPRLYFDDTRVSVAEIEVSTIPPDEKPPYGTPKIIVTATEPDATPNDELRELVEEWKTWVEEAKDMKTKHAVAIREVEKCAEDLEQLIGDGDE